MKKKTYLYLPVISVLLLAAAAFFSACAIFSKSLKYPFAFIGYGGTFKWHSFTIGGMKVQLYYLFMFFGFLGMCYYAAIRRNIMKFSLMGSWLAALYLALMGVVGAKLLYIIENIDKVRTGGLAVGGVSFFGTVFFMPAAIWLLSIITKKPYGALMDYSTPSGVVMLAFIRTGCFLNGCCGGATSWIHGNPYIVPVQLIETALDFLLLYMILKFEERGLHNGGRYVLFMGIYGSYRFILEFLRERKPVVGTFSNGHIFGIIAALVLVIYLIVRGNKKRNTK